MSVVSHDFGDFCGEAAGLVLSSTSDTLALSSIDYSSDLSQQDHLKAAVGGSVFPNAIALDVALMRKKRLRRSVLNATNALEAQLPKNMRYKKAMLTLTYGDDIEWNPRHITGLIKCIREYLRRKGHNFYYVWVLENTKAGRPHYHILMWLPKGVTLPKPDKRGWWKQGHTKIEWVRKNAAAYIAKYCSKATDSQGFPKGAHLHGCGGLSECQRLLRSFWNIPQYVREHFGFNPFLRIVRAVGGGWVSNTTGEWLAPRYFLVSCNPLVIAPISDLWLRG